MMYAHVPGLKVVMPSTPADAKGLLKSAIRDDNPVIFLEPKLLYRKKGMVPNDVNFTIPLGTADIKREGHDLTIVTYGRTVQMVLEVADKLAEEGKFIEVVDLRTLVPLDREAVIRSVCKTHKLLVVHEAVEFCGFGAEIAGMVADSEAFYELDEPIKRVGAMSCPIPFNPNLEKHVLPNTGRIEAAARELL